MDKKTIKPTEPTQTRGQKIIQGAYDLSLGISIIVAILMGAGVGYLMVKIFEVKWVFWLGVFWGVGAGILNIYKAYKRAQKELAELAKNPKYDPKYTQHKKV